MLWVYPYLKRWNLSCLIATRTGQKLSGHMLTVGKSFSENICKALSIGGAYETVCPKRFVYMDETTVLFEAKPRFTVNKRGENSVSIHFCGYNNRRLTACIFVAGDGT